MIKTKKWIVFIGPPAVGKTTFSLQLKTALNAKTFCFDQEFPLSKLEDSFKGSKTARKAFLELILAEESEWIVIDDTCHFKSMQKQYILAAERSSEQMIQVLFIYISARNDQITELQQRNSLRETYVKSEEIEKMTTHLNESSILFPNISMLEYNFKEIPAIESVVEAVKVAFDNYKERKRVEEHGTDIKSDGNFYRKLNLALNKEISEAFKLNPQLNGENICQMKKAFIESAKSDDNLEDLIRQFRAKHLNK